MRNAWWHVYAGFEPASEMDRVCNLPHRGQVIHYYRKLRKLTQKEVAEHIGCNEQEMRRIEASADGPGDRVRTMALTRYLRIPAELMNLMDVEMEFAEKICHEGLSEQEKQFLALHRHLTGSEPISREVQWMCANALEMCIQCFWPLEPDSHPPLTMLDRLRRLVQARKYHVSPLTRISTEQLRLGLNGIDFWLRQFVLAATLSSGLRRSQYLYQRQAFAAIAGVSLMAAQNTEIDPQRRLTYEEMAVESAQTLENAELTSKSLISRAEAYLELRRDSLAIQDIEHMLFYLEIESDVLVEGGISNVFYLAQLLKLAEGYTHTRLSALLQKAIKITRATEDDLVPWDGTLPEWP